MRKNVLVTGCCGLLGRNIVATLLEESKYDNIIALDLLPSESIAQMFDFNSRILPVQFDLARLVDLASLESRSCPTMLEDVATIIHLAAIVDTRESDHVRKLVKVRKELCGLYYHSLKGCWV